MANYYIVPRTNRHIRRFEPVGFNGGRRLPLDVHVDSDEYVITAAVPGLKAKDLHIEILDDVLTFKVEIQQDEVEENGNGGFLLREIPHGSFSRNLILPDPIDASKVDAEVEDGLLTMRIPKADEARPREIKVKAR